MIRSSRSNAIIRWSVCWTTWVSLEIPLFVLRKWWSAWEAKGWLGGSTLKPHIATYSTFGTLWDLDNWKLRWLTLPRLSHLVFEGYEWYELILRSLSMMDYDGWDCEDHDSISWTTWWLGLAHGDMVWPPEVLWLICRARSPRSRTRRDRRGSRYRAKPLSTSTDLPLWLPL